MSRKSFPQRWAFNAYARVIHLGSSVLIELRPDWVWFFLAYLALTAANAGLAAANLLRPYCAVRRAGLRLLSDGIGAALFCWLLRIHNVASFSASSWSTEKSLEVTQAIDYWLAVAFPWSIVASVVIAGTGVYRMIRVNNAGSSSA